MGLDKIQERLREKTDFIDLKIQISKIGISDNWKSDSLLELGATIKTNLTKVLNHMDQIAKLETEEPLQRHISEINRILFQTQGLFNTTFNRKDYKAKKKCGTEKNFFNNTFTGYKELAMFFNENLRNESRNFAILNYPDLGYYGLYRKKNRIFVPDSVEAAKVYKKELLRAVDMYLDQTPRGPAPFKQHFLKHKLEAQGQSQSSGIEHSDCQLPEIFFKLLGRLDASLDSKYQEFYSGFRKESKTRDPEIIFNLLTNRDPKAYREAQTNLSEQASESDNPGKIIKQKMLLARLRRNLLTQEEVLKSDLGLDEYDRKHEEHYALGKVFFDFQTTRWWHEPSIVKNILEDRIFSEELDDLISFFKQTRKVLRNPNQKEIMITICRQYVNKELFSDQAYSAIFNEISFSEQQKAFDQSTFKGNTLYALAEAVIGGNDHPLYQLLFKIYRAVSCINELDLNAGLRLMMLLKCFLNNPDLSRVSFGQTV